MAEKDASRARDAAVWRLLCQSRKSGGNSTYKVEANSILDRVKSFLPQMEDANKKLMEEMKEEGGEDRVNIEHVDSSSEPYVEMNLALFEDDQNESEEDEAVSDEESDTSSEDEETECSATKRTKLIEEVEDSSD